MNGSPDTHSKLMGYLLWLFGFTGSHRFYYGKPVISFPIQGAFEQFLNAFYLERLGYGRYFTGLNPNPLIIPAFEASLADYQRNLGRETFCGNQEIFALVEQFIREKKLTY